MLTLFIPELLGNHLFWRNILAQEAQNANRIIQMGNLIGFKSFKDENKDWNLKVLRLVNAYRYTEENWLQLIGPNEMFALNSPLTYTSPRADEILRSLWFTSSTGTPGMLPAGVDKGRLVSHGGLTYGLWRNLGKPKTAEEAADALLEEYRNTIFQGKSLKLGYAPNFAASPIWADPIRETYPSWITADEEPPFGQIHAGVTLNSETARELMGEETSFFHWIDNVAYKPYGSIAKINGATFLGLRLNLDPVRKTMFLPDGISLYTEYTPNKK